MSVYKLKRYEILRIDLLLVALGIFCAAYYGWTSGWQGALFGLAAYVGLTIMGLLLR